MKVLIRAVTVLLVLCGAALAVVILRPGRVEPVPPQPAADSVAAPQAVGQFTPLPSPLPAPDLAFTTRAGEPKTLADFRGSMLLVNLWATWCVPCVAEMPALDRLQAKLGPALTVLAISQDRSGAQVVDPFLEKTGIKSLAVYLDTKSQAAVALGAQGLPTTGPADQLPDRPRRCDPRQARGRDGVGRSDHDRALGTLYRRALRDYGAKPARRKAPPAAKPSASMP
jgi:thiol-disulfide isomerase/thioredoxin